jgi:uncharacterized surface protein with fasciclin (FAS1) repeats
MMKNNVLKIFTILFTLSMLSCSAPTENSDNSSANVGSADNTETRNLGQAGVVDEESANNILNVAISSPDHTTLVAAVQAAQIEHVLVNAGPLTVFAPVNEAFAALPEGTVETLLLPENKADLAKILTRHAAPGTYKTMYLKDGMTLYMATGDYLPVVVEGEDYYVGGAKILGSVECSNGIVHVVDKVILPE